MTLARGATIFVFTSAVSLPGMAQNLTPAEAAAELFFARPFLAMSKTVSEGAVTYRGDPQLNDPDRAILSVAQSRADPCVFEAFFVEGLGPSRTGQATMNVTYVTSIDLRTPINVSMGSAIIFRRPKMLCSRAAIFDPTLRITFSENCQDEFKVDHEERMPRLKAAVEALRKACRW